MLIKDKLFLFFTKLWGKICWWYNY